MSALQRNMIKRGAGAPLRSVSEDSVMEPEEEDETPEERDAKLMPPPSSAMLPPSGSRRAKKPPANYTPLTWEGYFDEMRDVTIPDTEDTFRIYTAGTEGPLFVLIHGGGLCALSWALAAKDIKKRARVLAMDLRGHGDTRCADDGDLGIDRLYMDVIALLKTLYGGTVLPPTLMCGHSMGGGVALRVCTANELEGIAALILVDVVEGTAMASLAGMQTFLSNRPRSFKSVSGAIEWAVRSNMIRNSDSARISIPPQIRLGEDEKYHWRTDLAASERYWQSWFAGLSTTFLTARAAKLLILAGCDRLDTPLIVGQMQGKFQLEIYAGVGHHVQEDAADKTAETFLSFAERYRLM